MKWQWYLICCYGRVDAIARRSCPRSELIDECVVGDLLSFAGVGICGLKGGTMQGKER